VNAVSFLAVNAGFQMVVSSLLGFFMLVPMQPWGKGMVPKINTKALLAAHLDWLMLGFMQWGAAFMMTTWPRTASIAVAGLLVFGGWTNPTPYILRGVGLNAFVLNGSWRQRLAATIAGASSVALLVAWIWLLVLFFR